MNRFILIISLLFLTNCAYQPLINPETSRDTHNGNNIAGNYWKDLQACNYIYNQNTGILADKLLMSDKKGFIKKCMTYYGYSILN